MYHFTVKTTKLIIDFPASCEVPVYGHFTVKTTYLNVERLAGCDVPVRV